MSTCSASWANPTRRFIHEQTRGDAECRGERLSAAASKIAGSMARRCDSMGVTPTGRRPAGGREASPSWSSEPAPRSDAPPRRPLTAAEVRWLSRVRAPREEGLSVCTEPRGLNGGQARSERAQRPHLTGCWVAFCVLERDRDDRSRTIDNLKRHLSSPGRPVRLPALERLREAA